MSVHVVPEELSRIESDSVPWLAYPLISGSYFKILKVHEDTNTVILKFKMEPHVVTPRHSHHCMATAYTLDGTWFYGDLVFHKGDIAFENTTEIHQPLTREESAELLTTFIGGPQNDRLIEDFAEDGSSYVLRTRFFKALLGITSAQLAKLDLGALIG